MRKTIEVYSNYETADFLLDDYFIESIKTPNEQSDEFWNRLGEEYPKQQAKIIEAKRLLFKLSFVTEQPSKESKEKVWNKILAEKDETSFTKVVPIASGMRKRRWLLAAASVLLIVLTSAIFLYLNRPVTQLARTGYGQKKEITLPDNSTVLLNANSRVKYLANMNGRKAREVWVEGEALFNVKHKNKDVNNIKDGERFIVHLSNLDVEVLGTTFTVTDRRSNENVALLKGSIKITASNGETILMQPGDKVVLSEGNKQLQKEVVDAEKLASWKDNRLTFENTSLNDVIKMIEENYGYKVIVSDPSLLDKKITGTISSENQDVLFKALQVIFNVNLQLSGNTITISKK
jgi:transmembrane sensor